MQELLHLPAVRQLCARGGGVDRHARPRGALANLLCYVSMRKERCHAVMRNDFIVWECDGVMVWWCGGGAV